MSSRPSTVARRIRAAAPVLGLAIGLLTAASVPTPAAAQNASDDGTPPPCRLATLVVAGGAGSGTDLIARALAEAANRAGAKPPLKVRNIDGDAGIDGGRAVLDAPGDGCMMLAAHQGLLVNFLTWRAPFAWHDFRHVALLTRTPMALVAPVSASFTDAQEMLAAARNGTVTAGVGPGTIAEFALRAMAEMAEIEFEYDAIDGARERVSALLDGDIDLSSVPTALAKRLGETQMVRSIAVTDHEPSENIPNVATLRDQGVAFDYAIDLGILLPPSASEELAARLADSLEKALDDQEFQKAMNSYDIRIDFRPLTQYSIYWENLMATWREIAVEAGYERSNR